MDWVAGFTWTEWQPSDGLGGRNPWNMQRWYVAYPLSYRHVEELMAERGVSVDHATLQRWVVKYSPLLEEAFHRRKRSV